ncbi:MAG: acyl-CoA dehydrogenase [Ramlibacter sp.]|jgi:alkylation response protein AidB-like acyl-CoA dehydrogenase|nr:acyl-CoA dehydrogenase [Ramlibacter sp.]
MIETTTDYNAMDDDAFRTMVREFVEANYPPELRFQIGQLPHAVTRGWFSKLSERGWIAPAWPREYGGMGLNPTKRIIMAEVFDAHGCSRYADNGVMMTGPLLIKFGTPAQREFFLPKILSGEHVWCQGYSEPNSGSDLASLRTEAVWNGDGWTITGQKIWTSRADQAQWCHMLARTDKGAAKPQDGISYFLVPLDAPGVTIRPIKILSMHEDFCEVFFDNVKVPADALVGAVNKGWSVSKALMGGERMFLGAAAQSFNALALLRRIAKATGTWGEPAFMDRYARLAADFADHNSLYEAGLEKVRAGGELGLEGAMLKVHQTEMYKRIAAVAVEIAGPYSGVSASSDAVQGIQVASTFLASMAGTIYGGSSEVQRNILAKQVLHLP